MKCLYCDNEAIGKSRYCSDRCKVAYNRNKEAVTKPTVTPEFVPIDKPYPGGPDCSCWMCKNLQSRGKDTSKLNHGAYLTADQLVAQGYTLGNRVSLPGDIDYVGIYHKPPASQSTITGVMELVPNEIVYGRPAVRYAGDKFDTRPEPLDPADIPDPDNRCIYTGKQGRYIIDCTGKAYSRERSHNGIPDRVYV